jgi:hypothetical protein
MHKFYRCYLEQSKGEYKNIMFGVKYRDHNFFTREDDFWVNFEDVHAIYHQNALRHLSHHLLGPVSII